MEVPTKLTGEQPEITVLLSNKHGDIYKPFHCSVCGNIVFEYNEDEIRTIIPSGRPMLDKPGKVIKCSGVIRLSHNYEVYDILYQVMDSVYNLTNLDDIRTALQYLSESSQDKINARCKARYYVS